MIKDKNVFVNKITESKIVKKTNQKVNSKIAVVSPYISPITLNVNRLNLPVR